MGIKVKLVGLLKKYASQGDSVNLEDADGRTVAEVMVDLGIPSASVSIALVNGRHTESWDYILREGDELTLLPPIGGGCTKAGKEHPLRRRGHQGSLSSSLWCLQPFGRRSP